MNYWTQSKTNVFVAAHRGWPDKYPENTMEGFRAVVALGVDQIETDVHVTKDGELVLIHDDTVDRTTNGKGRVGEMTLAELKELDAGFGAKIPTLVELLELVKDHPTMTLDIELKEYPTEGREALAYQVCDQVLRLLDSYGFRERCVINSWSGKLNEYVRETYGNAWKQHVYYPQRHLGPCAKDPYGYAYCTCICGIDTGEFHTEDVRKLEKETGVRIWVGTYAKDEKTVEKAVELGAELITCNNPDKVLEILREMGLHK